MSANAILVMLIGCANGAPLPAEPVNVRRHGGEFMARKLTRVFWEKRKDGRWLRWEWTPGQSPDRTVDCGFSAIREDALLEG